MIYTLLLFHSNWHKFGFFFFFPVVHLEVTLSKRARSGTVETAKRGCTATEKKVCC